jgi:hypothetical protein
VVRALTQRPCDVSYRGAGAASRQFVDRTIESTVANSRPLERPKAVGENTGEVGGNRLDIPARAQTRCSERLFVKALEEVGDAAALCGHGVEYLFATMHVTRLGTADADAPQGGVTGQDQRVPWTDLLKDVLRNPLFTDDAPGQDVRSGFVAMYLTGADTVGE